MNRCPSCDSSESSIVERVRFDDGHCADRRECSVCGEQWMVPVEAFSVEPGDIEAIELREGDGDGPEEADGVEEWFR
ncbi:MAG TPA: hypothetical protein VFS55_04310 [Dokdonella sp.]|nr:hypothetical protein [Dokdonella sp.]